jgi:drug/metabolite transporter (DMT)-like permease
MAFHINTVWPDCTGLLLFSPRASAENCCLKNEIDMQSAGSGWGNGLLGVIIFSGSLPATRVAVGGFSALFLTGARAVIAALLGAVLLGLLREAWPQRKDLASLAIVSLGVVVGFPLLTALALQHITAAHSIVFIGLLPLSTAIFAVLRGGLREAVLHAWPITVRVDALLANFFSGIGLPNR